MGGRAATLPRPTPIKCDLIIRGGRVIDPSAHFDTIADVAISNGRIAAVAKSIEADAVDTIDARGKLVLPGLLDNHTHAARSAEGPGLILRDGITGWIDAGTAGADHIADTIAIARAAPQLGRVLINIGRAGLLSEGDTSGLSGPARAQASRPGPLSERRRQARRAPA